MSCYCIYTSKTILMEGNGRNLNPWITRLRVTCLQQFKSIYSDWYLNLWFIFSVLFGFFINSKCWPFVLEEPSQKLIGPPDFHLIHHRSCPATICQHPNRCCRKTAYVLLRPLSFTGTWDSCSCTSFQKSNYDANSTVQLASVFSVFPRE
jgi:hypothetical protein